MKHCHCGLKEHFRSLRVKKLGALGVFLMVAHILFHVVECLLIPALLVAFHGHSDQSVQASESAVKESIVDLELGPSPLSETNIFEGWPGLASPPFNLE